jgi:hypothetical protein
MFNRRRRSTVPPATVRSDRLGGVRPVGGGDDERPSREDRDYGQTIFTRPTVPLPRVLRKRR